MADTASSGSPNPDSGQSTRQILDELDALMQRMLAVPVQEVEDESPPAARPIVHSPPQRSVKLLPVPSVTVQAPHANESAPVVVAGDVPAFWPAPAERKQPTRRDTASELAEAPPYLPAGAEPLLPILLQRPKAAAARLANQVVPPAGSVGPHARPGAFDSPRPSWVNTAAPTAPVLEPGFAMAWLLTVNRGFDRITAVFGGAGRWLRGEDGRAFLGWSGISMIVVAAIWAALRFLG